MMDGQMEASILVVRAVDLGNAIGAEIRNNLLTIFIGPPHLFKLYACVFPVKFEITNQTIL